MKTIQRTIMQQQAISPQADPPTNGGGFDLFRLSRSKDIVDVCPNTLRAYFSQGLPFYKKGKATFVSKTELAAFIRS